VVEVGVDAGLLLLFSCDCDCRDRDKGDEATDVVGIGEGCLRDASWRNVNMVPVDIPTVHSND
jgi:hypothetical protein